MASEALEGAFEGKVGAYWGVYDADREPKFAFTKPIVRIPHWHVLLQHR